MTGEAKERLKVAAQNKEFKGGYSAQAPSENAAYTAPGRLGYASLELEDDPRVNAQLLPMLQAFGMGKHVPSQLLDKLNENCSLDDIAALIAEFEGGLDALYDGKNLPQTIPQDAHEPKVERTEETINGGDGQDLTVYIYHPAEQKEDLPGVMYTHGGGMVMIPTMTVVHDRWARSIAAQGCVVVMPNFRNAYTKDAYHHFPKGQSDCVAAAKWIIANKQKLRLRNLVLQGESGGGNLALSVALTANREGWVKDIAGVYAVVPYISNAYGWPEEKLLKELPSLVECHGYFIERPTNSYLAYFYTPNDEDQSNPLAWPYFASLEDMKGLPPHNLVMDELDPLKDEGISYFRRLVKAGVEARGSVNLGVVHGTSLIFRHIVPAYNKSAVRDIAAFAREL